MYPYLITTLFILFLSLPKLYAQSDSTAETNEALFPSVEKPIIDLVEKNKEAPREGGLLGGLFGAGKDPLAEEDEKSGKKKKKRRKKNEYKGFEVQRYFARSLKNGKQVEEVVYCTTNPDLRPSPYVDNVHYFAEKERKVISDSRYQADKGILMHGPYERYVDGQLVTRGYYYKGMKDGRWETFKRGTFQYKDEFYRGWYKGTRFTYYDKGRTKLKEALSLKDGVPDGYYIRVYPSGRVAERGYYKDGEKIYRWVEYFDRGGVRNRKREVQYDSKPFTDFEPYVRREWNEAGKLVIDRRK